MSQSSASTMRSLAVFVAVLLTATACGAPQPAGSPPATSPGNVAAAQPAAVQEAPFLHRPVNRVAPPFTLKDQFGAQVSLADFRGKWILVDWVFTNCLTFCPILTGDMHEVGQGIGSALGSDIELVTVSFDPTRDTPAVMQAHAAATTGGLEGWTWLTGTQEETDAVAAAYGVSFDPAEPIGEVAQFNHTNVMVIIDPAGRERHRYLGTGWSDDALQTLEAEVLSPAEPAIIAEAQPEPSEPAVSAVLEEAIALPWEDFELEPGTTSQVLYQFPNSGSMLRYVDQVGATAVDRGAEVTRLNLSAMKVSLIPWPDGTALGIGYDTNLAVAVEGESVRAVLNALSELDNEWCCGTP